MLFKGRLRLPSDAGEGIPIDLVIEDVFLSLDSGGDDFGEWRLDTVEIKRLFSNQFSMLLDGEEMVFVADDALGFAYDGLSAIEDVQNRLTKRRVFKRRKTPKKRTIGRTDAPETEEPESAPEPAVEPDATPDAPMPEVVPFFPEAAPSFADSVAENTVLDESIAPVAPKPIDVPDATSAPVVEEAAASVDPPALRDLPEPSISEISSGPFSDEDELVIEDVSAYGYVPASSEPGGQEREAVTTEPEDTEPEDDDIEIEEAAPATGAVLREVHPLEEAASGPGAIAADSPASDAPAPTNPSVPETHPLGELTEPEPELGETTPAPPRPATEQPELAEPDAPVAEPAATALPPDAAPSFAQWSSNGRAPSDSEPAEAITELDERSQDLSGPQTQKTGRHARGSGKSRSSLFGRKKSRGPEEHEHRYESSKTVGGITRRVCAICGHVSFAGEDVYQNW